MSDEIDDFFAEAYAEAESLDQPDVEVETETVVESEEVVDDVVEVEADNLDEQTETDEAQDSVSETEDAEAGEGTDEWDWQQFADKTVPLTNPDGTVTHMTLAELRDGGLRQADYTRKTQEVADVRKSAEWAQQVQDAFERDPLNTLRAFAQAYGITGEEQADPYADLDEDVRPWAERTAKAESSVSEMERRVNELEMERIKAEVRTEVETLKSVYGDTFNPNATLHLAREKRIGLEDAHLILSARAHQQTASAESAASKVAADAATKVQVEAERKRLAAKKEASSTSKRSFKAVEDISVDDFNTIDELFGLVAQSS